MNERQISLLAAFAAAKVDFAVVGGVAVNMHGYVRATNDLDIFIRPTEENARAAFQALLTLGVPLEGLRPGDLLDDEENLRFGPEEDHVDVLASIGEMTFDQVWRNRVETVVEGVSIPFISKLDLIENKRHVGWLRDLADVEELVLIDEVGEGRSLVGEQRVSRAFARGFMNGLVGDGFGWVRWDEGEVGEG